MVSATAMLRGGKTAPCLRGWVKLHPSGCRTLVEAWIQGLPESEAGFFALHIHEGRDCRGDAFPNTGSHYNPRDTTHPLHAGDLLPLLRMEDGSARMSVLTDRFRVEDVIGRTVVIHSHPDDFMSQPSGNAGSKIGCGVICPG